MIPSECKQSEFIYSSIYYLLSDPLWVIKLGLPNELVISIWKRLTVMQVLCEILVMTDKC